MDIDTPLPHVFCPASELRAVREGMSFSMFDPPRGPVQSPGGHTTCLLPMTGNLSVVNDSCGSPQRDFSGPHSQPIPFNSPFLMTCVCLLLYTLEVAVFVFWKLPLLLSLRCTCSVTP